MIGAVTPAAKMAGQLGRNVMKSLVRNGSRGGIPGENIPFNIKNRTRLSITFFLYGFTGFAAPYLVLEWQLRKTAT